MPWPHDDEQPLLERYQTAGLRLSQLFGDARFPDVEDLAAEEAVRAGPRQKAAGTIENFSRRPVPIDHAVFLFQDGRERCFGVVLRLGMQWSASSCSV